MMENLTLFDTHAHLNDDQFAQDMSQVIFRAHKEGVRNIAVVGFDLPSSIESIRIAKEYKGIFAVVGIHPHDAVTLDEKTLEKLTALAQESEVVAIGEIGLDYYHNLSPVEAQKKAFCTQIRLAKQLRLPIVVHDRDAHGDTMEILKQEQAGENGGILHCFSGSWEMACQCLSMGFYISFAGPVTFSNANRLRDIAGRIPLDRLLVETDCPYLSPHPFRGKRNEPARVRNVVEKIAEIRGMHIERLMEAVTANAFQVYRIKDK